MTWIDLLTLKRRKPLLSRKEKKSIRKQYLKPSQKKATWIPRGFSTTLRLNQQRLLAKIGHLHQGSHGARRSPEPTTFGTGIPVEARLRILQVGSWMKFYGNFALQVQDGR